MKRFFLLTILFFTIGVVYSTDYSRIDEQSHYVPFQLKTPVEIAKYLTRNLRTDEEKVRAIYFWTATNIRYDVEQIPGNDYRYHVSGNRNFLKEVLDSHKGVCQHYAQLFDTLCRSVGIESYFIVGYTRHEEQISELSHAWNAVKINGEFYDLDVTWSAGYIEDGKFRQEFHDDLFLVSPSKFITSHIPFDPIWQFLKNPVSYFAFAKGNFSNLKQPGKFNYSDSIKAIATGDMLTNLIHENQRIKSLGVSNNLIRNYVSQNQQCIVSERYNLAVQSFNKAVESFNFYILSKNKRFDGTKLADEKISEMLATTRQHLNFAENLLSFLNSDNFEFNRQMRDMQSSISELKKNIDDEDEFVKKYIKTPKPFRITLFYKLKQ